MPVGNAHPGPEIPGAEGNDEIQYPPALQQGHTAYIPGHHVPDLLLLVGTYAADYFQGAAGIPGSGASRRGRLNPLQPAGIGHHHALHIFD